MALMHDVVNIDQDQKIKVLHKRPEINHQELRHHFLILKHLYLSIDLFQSNRHKQIASIVSLFAQSSLIPQQHVDVQSILLDALLFSQLFARLSFR